MPIGLQQPGKIYHSSLLSAEASLRASQERLVYIPNVLRPFKTEPVTVISFRDNIYKIFYITDLFLVF